MQKVKYLSLCTLLFSVTLFPSCNKNNYRIMVVGVNNYSGWDETGILINSLKNKKVEKIDNISFYTGNINNKSVVIAESQIGTSEAAMTTTIGIKQYHPQYIISEGTSGGHHENVNVNDIVLGKDILDMASYEGPGDDPSKWVGKNNGLQHPTLYSDEKLLQVASKVSYEKGAVLPNGIISSSDCWNTGVEFINKLHGRYKEDCEEMESYAVANVSLNYKIPSIAIRSISNNIITSEEYDPTACEVIQNFVLDFIKLL